MRIRWRRLIHITAAFFVLSLFGIAASMFAPSEVPLEEAALFSRCYTHLTQQDLPLDHPLRAAVAAGSKSAVSACMQVLNSANLITSGPNEGRLQSDTPESRAVLNTLNSFHRSWFPNDDLMSSLGHDYFNDTRYLHDETEAALHVTRALFESGVPLQAIVTGSEAMEAIRSDGPSNMDANRPDAERFKHSDAPAPNNTTIVNLNAQLVQFGDLLGVHKMSMNPAKDQQLVNSSTVPTVGTTKYGYGKPIRMHESLGGGILGTKSYLLLNLGRQDTLPMNGGLRMPRRWAKAVFADFLCHEVPVIRSTDALGFVQTNVSSATPPFRSSVTCMGCHASMDPMAAAARNVSIAGAADIQTAHLYFWPTTLPAETGVVDDDPDYFQRPTTGTLRFRSYDGTLVERSVASVAGLGQAIAETNDFYACVASRYFQYFTGIGVNLQDIGDTNLPVLDQSELSYRNFVIDLGQKLKSNQSLSSLIESILSSSVYRKISMRNLSP